MFINNLQDPAVLNIILSGAGKPQGTSGEEREHEGAKSQLAERNAVPPEYCLYIQCAPGDR
jgi:hypothetical protein